jgi:galactokinase
MSTDTTIGSYPTDMDTFAHQLRGELGAPFCAGESKWIARATRALDCMGGFAEYCGALTLSLSTADAVYAAVQARHDQNVQVNLLSGGRNGHPATATFPLSLWYEGTKLVDAPAFVRRVEDLDSAWAEPVIGVLYVLLSDGRVPHLCGGLTIVVASQLPWEADGVVSSAATAATMAAVCKCFEADLPPKDMGLLCQQVQNHILGIPCGPSAAACALLGESGSLLQVLCQPLEVVGRLPVPERVALMGIDCGARHPAAAQKFREARVAAFMGRRIIERVLAARGQSSDWGGYVARVSVCDYVDTFRDRLPTKMRGKDFLARFGPTGDPLTAVEENAVYKIRSRTEHHIYENARAHQFAERLARTQRTGEQGPLLEAGELMFASHWSYGQRCGLGSIETDKLVTSLRRRGPRQGIFGAKICGLGAGGTVVVLLSDTEPAHQAVRETVADYVQATGCRTRLLIGSSDGAAAYGVRQVA